MKRDSLGLLRWSLVITWLATAAVTLIEWQGQSLSLLTHSGLVGAAWAPWLIGLGAFVDVVIGMALALKPNRIVYFAALTCMTSMTVVATVLLPALWFDPLGPLLKNLPIAACLLMLIRRTA
jgi:hypothetical protein